LARDERLSSTPIDWHDRGTVRLFRRIPGGVLNPPQLQAALLAAARAAGATIINGATVSGITPGGKGVEVSLRRGTTTAAAGIMAVDAMCWRPGFDPWRERVMTVSLQTVPLAADQLAALGLEPDEAFYTVDTPLLWGRVMPDRSLLAGRETNPFPQAPDMRQLNDALNEAASRLSERIRRLHPRCRALTFDEPGPVRSHARRPVIRRWPRIHWCRLCSGRVATAVRESRRDSG